jgi:hypothetical protein
MNCLSAVGMHGIALFALAMSPSSETSVVFRAAILLTQRTAPQVTSVQHSVCGLTSRAAESVNRRECGRSDQML